mgnify:CR=1 FL=1
MKNILKMLKNYKKEAILGPLFKLFEAIFELCIPLIVASLIDNGLKINDSQHVLKMSILLIVFPLIGLIFSIIAQYYSAFAAVHVATNLRHDLFTKIQSLSYSEYDIIGSSSLITTMTSDVNQVQTGVNLMLRLLLRSPIVVLGATIMAFLVDGVSGFIFLLVTILLSVIVFFIMRITIPLYSKVQGKLDKILKSTRENLSGVRVIRAFNHEKKEVQEFQELNDDLTKTQTKVGKISALLNPLTFVIINAAIIVLIYIGAIKVNYGSLTQGKVIALYNYMSLILVELIKFANLLITLNKSVACANRINEIMMKESSLKFQESSFSSLKDEVVFENVSLTYPFASKEALNDISFKATKGEMIGIIGATGSGKTSLIHLIPHFYDVSAGNVYVEGKNVASYDVDELRNKIAIVPQKAVLFKGTIKENLLWGNKNASDEEIINALELACATEIIENKENGINSLVTQEGKNFSGGQRQRLTLARALLRKSNILILDDSTSALDFATDAKIRQSLKNLPYRPTIFIVSQRTSSIRNADKIIVLDKGKMVGIGTHDELIQNCETYREIHFSQTTKEAR